MRGITWWCGILALAAMPVESQVARGETALGDAVDADRRGDYATARRIYRGVCDAGDVRGCTNLAILLDFGRGGPREPQVAEELYTRACFNNSFGACNNLGEMLISNRARTRDPRRARAVFQQACANDFFRACTNLGILRANAVGGPLDLVGARIVYTKACEGGSADGCNNLAELLATGKGGAEDFAAARRRFSESCEGGFAPGCANLGRMTEVGIGGDADPSAARVLYELACSGGFEEGCGSLGQLLTRIELAENDAQARALHRRACTEGVVSSCGAFGVLLTSGRGGPRDESGGREFLQRGCQPQTAEACVDYGEVLVEGIGGPADASGARTAFETACTASVARGCTRLAQLVANGVGGPAHPVRADSLFEGACRAGDTSACRIAAARTQVAQTPRMPEAGRAATAAATTVPTGVAAAPAAARLPVRPEFLPPALSIDSASVRFVDANQDGRIESREEATLTFAIRNTGQGVARRLIIEGAARYVLGGEEAPISGLRLEHPQLAPGASATVRLVARADSTIRSGRVRLDIRVRDVAGFTTEPMEVVVEALTRRPARVALNGIAVVAPGGRTVIRPSEVVEVTLRIANTGDVAAEGIRADIRPGRHIFLAGSDQRLQTLEVGRIDAGAHRDVTFRAYANEEAGGTFPVELTLRNSAGQPVVDATDLGLRLEAPQRSALQLEVAARAERPADDNRDRTTPVLGSSLLENIPLARSRNPDAIAVIIGNRAYQNAPFVNYAVNDAAVVRQYAERALGIPEANILYIEDATLTNMRLVFGDRGNADGRLRDFVKRGRSDVFVFYSGHGAPEVQGQRAYLVPVDGDVNRLALTALPLEVLYENLAALGARHVTVVIDACFSGASGGGDMLIQQASPIGIVVRDPSARFAEGGATIITAAAGQELASWHPQMRHGLLTYFFLKGLQGEADADRNGEITVGELRRWIVDENDGVPYAARRLHGRQQTPQVWGQPGRVVRR